MRLQAHWICGLLVACSTPTEVRAQRGAAPTVEPTTAPAPLRWRRVRVGPLSGAGVVPRIVTALVPEVPAPAGGFPFVVVTDGDLVESAFAFPAAVAARRSSAPPVLIAVPAVERTEELTPSAADLRALGRGRDAPAETGVLAFLNWIARTVLPAVDAEVPLGTAAADGTFFGYSYGGLAAIYAGILHADRFGAVIAMSPSAWFRGHAVLRHLDGAEAIAERWWVDVGTGEGGRHEVVPGMLVDARSVRDALERKGRELGTTLGYREEPGRPHSMEEASRRLPDALEFLARPPRFAPRSLSVSSSRTFHRGARGALSVRAEGEIPLSLATDDVRFESSAPNVLRVSRDGVWQARRAGHAIVTARLGALSATLEVQVQ